MKRILLPLLLFIACSLLFLSLFQTELFQNLVLFYRGIVFLLMVSIVYWFFTKSRSLVVVFFCMHLTFFTLVPVTLDRSISVFMLDEFNKAGELGVSENQMEISFIENYVKNKKALPKRYAEQLQSGTIRTSKNGFIITAKGVFLHAIFGIVGKLYGL